MDYPSAFFIFDFFLILFRHYLPTDNSSAIFLHIERADGRTYHNSPQIPNPPSSLRHRRRRNTFTTARRHPLLPSVLSPALDPALSPSLLLALHPSPASAAIHRLTTDGHRELPLFLHPSLSLSHSHSRRPLPHRHRRPNATPNWTLPSTTFSGLLSPSPSLSLSHSLPLSVSISSSISSLPL